MNAEIIMDRKYNEVTKTFRLVFGNTNHIQIAQLMADIIEKKKKKRLTEKVKQEIASLQSKAIYLIKEGEKI